MNGTTENIDYKSRCSHLEFKVEELNMQLAALRRMIFGSKHERFIPSETIPGQLSLDIAAEQAAACEITSVTEVSYQKVNTEKKSNHHGRMFLPEHLPRVITRIEPEPVEGYVLSKNIEVTEQLDFEPGRFWVNRTERVKLMKKDPNGPGPLSIIAALPPAPMHKCMASPGLIANILVDKFVDHLPLHRQQKRYARAGMELAYSTIGTWTSSGIGEFEDFYELHKAEVLSADYLQADETGTRVIDKQKEPKKDNKDNKLHDGWFWLYQDVVGKKVFFDYRKGRGREGPCEILKDFKGHLQTDGWDVYDRFAKDKPHITLLCCWAHARRYYEKAKKLAKKTNAELEHPLAEIQKLYAIERHCKTEGLDYAGIRDYRQKHAKPILEALFLWIKAQRLKWGNVNKLPFVEALNYSLNHWDKLCVYLQDGRLSIDSNPVENSVRPTTLGRKNVLFAGSHEAAQRSAMMYSLFGTCKLHDINPLTWLPQHWKPLEEQQKEKEEQKQEEAATQ